MKKFFKKYWLGILLIVGHTQVEFYRLVWLLFPQTATEKVNWFIDQTAVPQGMTPLWYIKGINDHIIWIIVMISFARIARRTSRADFMVVSVFGIYHLFDLAMYLFDFSQSRGLYLVFLAFDVAALVALFWPYRPHAKVVIME